MQVDILKELRLRRWARENYVSAQYREAGWHPIVLHEMQLRDAELIGELAREEQRIASQGQRVVPLMPDSGRRFDEEHEEIPSPNFLREPARTAQDIGMYYQ